MIAAAGAPAPTACSRSQGGLSEAHVMTFGRGDVTAYPGFEDLCCPPDFQSTTSAQNAPRVGRNAEEVF
jgi:hypothetical protein